MKYFVKFFDGSIEVKDIDITVHCDINIFEWLMKYVGFKHKMVTNGSMGFAAKHLIYRKLTEEEKKAQETSSQPVLQIKNVISILISSEFLRINEIVKECIAYIISNLHDIVRLPINMDCIHENIIYLIAQQLPLEKLNDLHDKRDKLTSRLFKAKLD